MKKNNIEKIYDFLSTDKETTLLVNQVSDEIYCFYDYINKNFTNKLNIKINYNTVILIKLKFQMNYLKIKVKHP